MGELVELLKGKKTEVIKKEVKGAPDVHDIQVDIMYSFTIAPADECQVLNDMHTMRRVTAFYNWWKNKMDKLMTNGVNYKLYVEVSQGGRLHWHGYIWFDDVQAIADYYIRCVPVLNKICRLELDNIDDPKIWHAYCVKQRHLFKHLLKSRVIRNDIVEVQEEEAKDKDIQHKFDVVDKCTS